MPATGYILLRDDNPSGCDKKKEGRHTIGHHLTGGSEGY